MPSSSATLGGEEAEVKIVNDHIIVTRSLKSEIRDFSEGEGNLIGNLKAELLVNVADQYKGLPIYVDHQRTKFDKVGVVKYAWYSHPYLYTVIELFSYTPEHKLVIQQIREGKIKAVSSGFNFEYLEAGEGRIDIFEIYPFEVSLMMDWIPKCPECTLEYRNFGVRIEGKEHGDVDDVEETPLIWVETDHLGEKTIVISQDAEKMGLKDAILEILQSRCGDDEEQIAPEKEIVIEIDGDLENFTAEIVSENEESGENVDNGVENAVE